MKKIIFILLISLIFITACTKPNIYELSIEDLIPNDKIGNLKISNIEFPIGSYNEEAIKYSIKEARGITYIDLDNNNKDVSEAIILECINNDICYNSAVTDLTSKTTKSTYINIKSKRILRIDGSYGSYTNIRYVWSDGNFLFIIKSEYDGVNKAITKNIISKYTI
ncbi:MAG: hypothetical protein KJ674_01440 [Nanoarchaeota archaeon]|nr:hypothetical protein [Nanoarchaeota archaeon]